MLYFLLWLNECAFFMVMLKLISSEELIFAKDNHYHAIDIEKQKPAI